MAETVRFSELVKYGGSPEIYLPLMDPGEDKKFMQAAKANRVVSLKQEPTGNKKDFGMVQYEAGRFFSYLIFPKPLSAYKGKRVIGIKYESLQEGKLTPAKEKEKRIPGRKKAAATKPTKEPLTRPTPKLSIVPKKAQPPEAKEKSEPKEPPKPAEKPKPIEKPKPQPKHFVAKVRLTWVEEVEVTVTALTKKEAQKHATEQALKDQSTGRGQVTAKVVGIHESASSN